MVTRRVVAHARSRPVVRFQFAINSPPGAVRSMRDRIRSSFALSLRMISRKLTILTLPRFFEFLKAETCQERSKDRCSQRRENASGNLPASGWWYERTLTEGNIVDEIFNAVKEWRADLMVLPTQGYRDFLNTLRGSMTERVLRGAHCPVLAIPHVLPQRIEASGSYAILNKYSH